MPVRQRAVFILPGARYDRSEFPVSLVKRACSMRQVIDYFIARIQDHWIQVLLAAGFTVLGWIIGRYRNRRAWQRREFFDRLNISLNIIRDGKLHIRTLLEKRCEDVFLNGAAAKEIIRLAQLTTPAEPLIPLAQDDCWYYLNSLLNEIAEKFATGAVRQDMGLPVQKATYLICLTCETAGTLRQKKIRAMMIQQATLEKLPEQMPALDSPHHATRWDTLQKLSASWQKTPWKFLKLEISQ